jgi:serine/threonine-protein kinase
MPPPTPDQFAELLAQVRADQVQRWRSGDHQTVERYLLRHPALAAEPSAVLALVRGEILLRMDQGETPSLEEYRRRFPALADSLRGIWSFYIHAESHLTPAIETGEQTTAEASGATGVRALFPRALPGFELLELLGEGGMGVVLKARQIDLDRVVALKLIRLGPLAGAHLLARFHTEEKAIARLNHPGVVRIYSTGQHEGLVFFCMEYLAGGSLATRLRAGPLPIRTAAEMIKSLAQAVGHAHEQGVLHRDLKPANVLLTAEGAPRVADFGLAKLLDADDGLTSTGMVMGTPSYMAPEQTFGQGDIDARTDVYALGAIFYECLTGQPPFRGRTRQETMEQVRTALPLPPRTLRRDTPRELEAICLKCLEKAREDRYPGAQTLADDLQRWLEGHPIQAATRWPAWLRNSLRNRRRLVLALAAGAGLAAVGWLGLGLFRAGDSSEALLVQIRRNLAAGKTVTLQGVAGTPGYRRWVVGQVGAKEADEETFTVSANLLALLELLPDPGRESYRLRAEVRHTRTNPGGCVGVYVAHRPGRPAEPIHEFVAATFNDIIDAGDEFDQLQREDPKMIGPRPLNTVLLAANQFAGKGWEDGPRLSVPLLAPPLFRATGLQTPGWRSLAVEVTPSTLRVFWAASPDPAGTIAVPQMLARVRHNLDVTPVTGWQPLPPAFHPRGGLGLLVEGGVASFRNVLLEPLS